MTFRFPRISGTRTPARTRSRERVGFSGVRKWGTLRGSGFSRRRRMPPAVAFIVVGGFVLNFIANSKGELGRVIGALLLVVAFASFLFSAEFAVRWSLFRPGPAISSGTRTDN